MAYGAAIYLRTTDSDSNVSTSLVIAKSRVLPVQPITILRAELTGALLMAELLSHCMTSFSIPSSQVHAWTDSQIVLHWLPKTPSQLDRFVAHRIHKIQQKLPGVTWCHVASEDNPADLASRGVRGPELSTSALWWAGPSWLLQPQPSWPKSKIIKPATSLFSVSIKLCLQLPQARIHFLHSL